MATLRESMAWFSKIIPIYLMSILIETTLATLDEDSVPDFVLFPQGNCFILPSLWLTKI